MLPPEPKPLTDEVSVVPVRLNMLLLASLASLTLAVLVPPPPLIVSTLVMPARLPVLVGAFDDTLVMSAPPLKPLIVATAPIELTLLVSLPVSSLTTSGLVVLYTLTVSGPVVPLLVLMVVKVVAPLPVTPMVFCLLPN